MMSRRPACVTLWVWLCGHVIVWAPGPLCLADCDPANQGEKEAPPDGVPRFAAQLL